ncbi:response regulator [Salinarimonas soli]|uniref:Regulatory protein VirG n=1 Tax=Salinarimonas soli TaxID=1638099 RepID=A0A5B2VH92_9HYPH|nr:response regulator transcription factor [Salinarimonas soli]KAA2237557.1 response regulator transcription factor [Salinarimonas soli]
MPTIAIVEDEPDLREAVAEYLSERGLTVVAAGSAAEFRAKAANAAIDVAVLDLAMAGEDGLSLARWLTGLDDPPGIIMATAAGSAVDRVVGLEVGADDYLVKPYDLRELLARIRSVLRRLPPAAARRAPVADQRAEEPGRLLPVGRDRLDLQSRQLVKEDGRLVALTAAEFDLLEVLARRPNRPLSRGQLLDLAQAREDNDSERSIDVRITRLRRKLESDPGNPSLIRTVRGEGYMFVPDGA